MTARVWYGFRNGNCQFCTIEPGGALGEGSAQDVQVFRQFLKAAILRPSVPIRVHPCPSGQRGPCSLCRPQVKHALLMRQFPSKAAPVNRNYSNRNRRSVTTNHVLLQRQLGNTVALLPIFTFSGATAAREPGGGGGVKPDPSGKSAISESSHGNFIAMALIKNFDEPDRTKTAIDEL
jgi:hypothetical protein